MITINSKSEKEWVKKNFLKKLNLIESAQYLKHQLPTLPRGAQTKGEATHNTISPIEVLFWSFNRSNGKITKSVRYVAGC